MTLILLYSCRCLSIFQKSFVLTSDRIHSLWMSVWYFWRVKHPEHDNLAKYFQPWYSLCDELQMPLWYLCPVQLKRNNFNLLLAYDMSWVRILLLSFWSNPFHQDANLRSLLDRRACHGLAKVLRHYHRVAYFASICQTILTLIDWVISEFYMNHEWIKIVGALWPFIGQRIIIIIRPRQFAFSQINSFRFRNSYK